MNNFEDLWLQILADLKETTTPVMYNLYPTSMKFTDYKNDTIYFTTDSEYKKTVIDEKFIEPVEQAFFDVLGFPVKVIVSLINSEPPAEENEDDGKIQETTDRQLKSRYTFDNFVTGSENQFAYNVAYTAALNPGTKYNPVFIYGASGLGKTHLMLAAYNLMMAKNPDAKIIITSGESFLNELYEHIGKKTNSEFHNKYRNADALFIDDIQFIATRGATVQEEIFNCFNTLFDSGKQIFMVSDRPPKEMTTLEERLRSRFLSGIIQDILPPDKDTRIVIVQKKAQQLDITIDDKIVDLIAEKIKTNVRQIEGVVNKISAFKAISKADPGIDKVRAMINEITNDNQPASVTIDKILDRVSTDMEVPVAEIKSKKRDKKIKDARQICIYIIRQKTNLTLADIGEIFDLSHSTVLHSISQVEHEKEANPSLKITLDNIVNDF